VDSSGSGYGPDAGKLSNCQLPHSIVQLVAIICFDNGRSLFFELGAVMYTVLLLLLLFAAQCKIRNERNIT
jgi:hypothetical protein